jgi:hypothetical protein
MKAKTDLFYQDWCENDEERCYYYDQSSFNQTKLCNDKILTVPGLVIYDEKRLHSATQSVTLHMICDQYGAVLHYDVCSGGTTKEQIKQFLQEARDRLPQPKKKEKPKKPLLFLDHLSSHVSLQRAGMKGWDLQLIPVTCPDANVIEYLFSSIKAYFRKVSREEATMNVTDWIEYVKEQIKAWRKTYKADSGIFNHCREFVEDLIESGGDIQLAKLKKMGFKSIEAFQNSIPFDDSG